MQAQVGEVAKVAEVANAGEADEPQELKFGFRSTLDGDYEVTKKLGKTAVPLHLPDQTCCLVSKAGPELSTKASSVVIQIVGTFSDPQERQQHIEESTFNMLTFMADTCKPFFVGSRELSPDEQTAAVERIVENTHIAYQNRIEKEREYIQKKRNGEETIYEEAVKEAQEKNDLLQQVEDTIHDINQSFFHSVKQSKETKRRTVSKFSPMSAIPGQAFAVVSILRDELKELEPDQIEDEWAVAVWGCFPTKTEAEIYKSDTLQHERPEWDHFIIPNYKPLYLDLTRTKLQSAKNVFRYDVHTQMEAQQQADERMIEDLKTIPRDEHGRMIRETTETPETPETTETPEAELEEGGGTK